MSDSEDNSEYVDTSAAPSSLTTEQEYLKSFILYLESLPEIWDPSRKDYSNKLKRSHAYEKLLLIYKKIKQNATVDDVRKKINSLRSNYKKELKKILESKRSGAGTDQVYTPKSWVFHMMHFLKKNEQPVGLKLLSQPAAEEENSGGADLQDITEQTNSTEEAAGSSFSSINIPPPPPRKIKKMGPIAKQNELIEKACSILSSKPPPTSTNAETNVNPTALYWSDKLEKLHPTQRMFAEKAINDILFEAQLGTLGKHSVQINMPSLVSSPMYTANTTPSPVSSISMSRPPSAYTPISAPSPPVPSPVNYVSTDSTYSEMDKTYNQQIREDLSITNPTLNTGLPLQPNIHRHTMQVPESRQDGYTLTSLFSSLEPN